MWNDESFQTPARAGACQLPGSGGLCLRRRRDRYGVFLRSEAPCDVGTGGIAFLRDYGLTATIDLRGEGEAAWRPSALAEAFPYPADSPDRRCPRPLSRKICPKVNSPGTRSTSCGRRSTGIGSGLASPPGAEADGCVLYHCTTGKDRTGILTCCLLGAVGVSREDIAADYCLSQVYLQPMVRRHARRHPHHPSGEDPF